MRENRVAVLLLCLIATLCVAMPAFASETPVHIVTGGSDNDIWGSVIGGTVSVDFAGASEGSALRVDDDGAGILGASVTSITISGTQAGHRAIRLVGNATNAPSLRIVSPLTIDLSNVQSAVGIDLHFSASLTVDNALTIIGTASSAQGISVPIYYDSAAYVEGTFEGPVSITLGASGTTSNIPIYINGRGELNFNDTLTLSTLGNSSSAIFAGGTLELTVVGGTVINTAGTISSGILSSGSDTLVFKDDLTITTLQDGSMGISVSKTGTNTPSVAVDGDLTITTSGGFTSGMRSSAIYLSGNASALSSLPRLLTVVGKTKLTVNGAGSTAANNQPGLYMMYAEAVFGDIDVTTSGVYSGGIYANMSKLTVGKTTINTAGNTAHASVNIGGITTYLDDTYLHTEGNSSYGLHLSTGTNNMAQNSTVEGNLTIKTEGQRAYGIMFEGSMASTLIAQKDIDIETTGSGGIGIYRAWSRGHLEVGNNLTIKTYGAGAVGLHLSGSRYDDRVGYLSVVVKGDLDIKMEYTGTDQIDGLAASAIYALGFYDTDGGNTFSDKFEIINVAGSTTIESKAYNAAGIRMNSLSAVFGSKPGAVNTITMTGDYARAIDSSEVIISFAKTSITTSGEGGTAALFDGRTTKITFREELSITSTGYIGRAMTIQNAAEVLFKGEVNIKTTGEFSSGILVLGTDYNMYSGELPGYYKYAIATFESPAYIHTTGDSSNGIAFNGLGFVDFQQGGSIITEGNSSSALSVSGSNNIGTFNDTLLESKNSAVITNWAAHSFRATFTGASAVHGDILLVESTSLAYPGYGRVTLNLEDTSYFRGGALNPLGDGTVNLNLSGSAYWDVVDDFRLDTIDMSESSKILFSHPTAGTYYTASVENLVGSGVLVLNVDAATVAGVGDKLLIGKATGTFKLDVKDKTAAGIDALMEQLTLIEVGDITDAPTFSLVSSSGVVLGGMLYKLVQNGSTWELILSPVPEDVISGTNTSMVGLFELAKAIDASISDELLEARKTVWVVAGYKRQSFRNLSTDDDLRQNIFNLITGMDIASKDDWNFGAFLGLTIGNQDVNDVIISTTDAFTLGFNAIYENNGLIASGYVRLASYLHRIEVIDDPDLMKGRLTTFGISASIQATKKVYVLHPSVYIAPKAKLSFTHIFGFEHDFDLLTLTGKPAAAFVAWVGARIGGDIKIREIPATIYGEAGFIYDTNPSITIFIDDEEKELKLDGKHYEFGVGINVIPTYSSSFTFEYKFSISKNLVEPVKIKISATTSF